MTDSIPLPPNTQLCLPSSHAVLPGGFTRGPMTPFYLTSSTTSSPAPIFPLSSPSAPFVVIHPSFLRVLGPSPSLKVIAKSSDGRHFAHEAGVWIEETQEVIFTSNLYKPHTNVISRIRLDALERGRDVYSSWDDIETTPEEVTTGNGATLYGKDVLVCSQGVGTHTPSSLTVMSPLPPFKSYPILNNFHGRPFNSVNDVVILPAPSLDPAVPHPTTDRSDLHHLPHTTIWFTDVTYGHLQAYKPKPQLPNQIYCFNPTTGDIRVVACGIPMPNGICFNHTGTKAYVTDTACVDGDGTGNFKIDGARGGAIYVFDVVWNEHGTLIGRIVLFPDPKDGNKPHACANFNFCPDGRLFILAEDRIFVASLNPEVQGAL
ncbi:hypothetical protein RQP46_002524 [Phenoliferia psychrophenolica]